MILFLRAWHDHKKRGRISQLNGGEIMEELTLEQFEELFKTREGYPYSYPHYDEMYKRRFSNYYSHLVFCYDRYNDLREKIQNYRDYNY